MPGRRPRRRYRPVSDDELPAAAAAHGRGLPARRRRLQGGRARAAAGLHAAPDARRLRHGRAAADDDHPRLDRRCGSGSARRSCASTTSTRTRSAGAAWRARRPARSLRRHDACARSPSRSRPSRCRALLLGARAARPSSAPPRSACGRSRTSSSPTRCCGCEERARAFVVASLANVALTVALTVWLVVVRDEGALGLLLGNYAASAVVLVGLWVARARRARALPGGARPGQLGPMLRFGLPTVPAEVSVFALFFVDRLWLYRFESAGAAGLYSLSVKLAGVVVFTVRAFQYAWPPLAYSIADDAEAAPRLRAHHDLLRAVHRPRGRGAGAARPLGGARVRRARVLRGARGAAVGRARAGRSTACSSCSWRWPGRAQVTVRNAPAALCGLAVNVALLALLVGAAGDRGRRARAGRRLRRDARGDVGAHPQAVPGARSSGARLAARGRRGGRDRRGGRAAAAHRRRRRASWPARAALAAIPPVLWATGFFRPGELAAARELSGGPARAWGVARSEPARTPRGGG